MPNAKLKYNNREIMMGAGVTTFGRTTDNAVSFADDANVSRYHAEIEKRGEEFWVVDLGSSNGTSVNGNPVKSELLLQDGDNITFGGTSTVKIEFIKEKSENPDTPTAPRGDTVVEKKEEPETGQAAESESKPSKTLMVAGATVGLAVIFAVGAGAFYYSRTAEVCDARAVITKPEAGDTILNATEIEIDLTNGGCVQRAIYMIDGEEVARSEDKPFTAPLNPKELADLSDGFEHNLQVVLEDKEGNRIVQPNFVALAFETREIVKPTPAPEIVKADTKPTPKNSQGKQISLIDVQNMSKSLVKQFAGNFAYNVSNKQFLAEVQKKTAEYAQEGYFDRAAVYRDAINSAYVREQNLDAPLGFILAMSRSKFIPAKQGNEEGLWRMTTDFVTVNAYNGLCGAETLSDASQNCAAKSSALYMKALVFGVFDGDIVYSAAAFGKSPQDAGMFKASLPADRSDFWNAVKTTQEREQIVRFFAAGIVAENPQKFGLKKDKPLSELYRVTM
jgi:hypothetical protein